MYAMDRYGGDIRREDGVESPNECGRRCENEPGGALFSCLLPYEKRPCLQTAELLYGDEITIIAG